MCDLLLPLKSWKMKKLAKQSFCKEKKHVLISYNLRIKEWLMLSM